MFEEGIILCTIHLFLKDSHSEKVEKDAVNNYVLLYLMQGSMYTEVHFRRALHTGDCKEDIAIMVRELESGSFSIQFI